MMRNLFHLAGNAGYSSPQPAAKVRGEGQDIAGRSINGSLSKVLDVDGNRGYSSARPAARVRPDAEHTYQQHRGTLNKVLDQDANAGYLSPAAGPRVRPEAEEAAVKGRGRMDVVLGAREAPPTPVGAAARVKPEAEEAAHRNKGVLSKQISNYGNLPQSDRPAPRNRGEGNSNEEAGRGSVQHLFNRSVNMGSSQSSTDSRAKFLGSSSNNSNWIQRYPTTSIQRKSVSFNCGVATNKEI